MNEAKTVAIVGAGPVGLAAAAHVLERGMTPIVLEAGPEPAHAVRQWRHVQLFSPWEYNVDKASERLLSSIGWNSPDPHVYPTGAELLERYLDPLAGKTILKDVIRTSSPDISHYLCTMGAHGAMASPLFGGRAGSLRPAGRERSLGFCWAAGSSEGLVSVGLG
jgi:hypothetical protein